MAWRKEEVTKVIKTLRRQRIRQGDLVPVLDCLIAQARELGSVAKSGELHDAAAGIRAQAFELRRMAKSLPKFVVEDLLEESIARLERLRDERR